MSGGYRFAYAVVAVAFSAVVLVALRVPPMAYIIAPITCGIVVLATAHFVRPLLVLLVGTVLTTAVAVEAMVRGLHPARLAASVILTAGATGLACYLAWRLARLRDRLDTQLSGLRSMEETLHALRESEERFRMVFEDGPVGMAIVGMDTRLVRVNSAFCRMLGYPRAELEKKTVAEVTHPEDLAKDLPELERLKRGDTRRYSTEKRYLTRSGHELWGALSAAIVRDLEGRPLYFMAVIEDVSERRRAQSFRDEYVSLVSHDLRSPLSAVLVSAGILRAAKGLDAGQRAAVEAVLGCGRRMDRLLDDLVDTARLEAGRLQLRLAPTELCRLTTEAVARLGATAERVRVDCERPVSALADAERLERVLDNLVGNAAKYAPDAGEIVVRVVEENGLATVSVSDRGPGIPLAEQGRVFDRYYRGTAENNGNGAGLGLYISRLVVEAHGGRIWVESEPGRGATFRFALPLAPAVESAPEAPAVAAA